MKLRPNAKHWDLWGPFRAENNAESNVRRGWKVRYKKKNMNGIWGTLKGLKGV